MNIVLHHYQELLAPVYSWMLGNWDERLREERELLKRFLHQHSPSLAIDLGCGSGLQALALADLGYEVLAVDFCEELLEELKIHQGSRVIRTLCADIKDLKTFQVQAASLISCMGDTLPHLDNLESVRKLIIDASSILNADGRLLLGFRDLSHELEGSARFIPVRSDDSQILTCFLEYEAERVWVHDLLYKKDVDGIWRMQTSRYPKLRLSLETVEKFCNEAGFYFAEKYVLRGMTIICAMRS